MLGALRPIRRADGYEDDIAVSKRNLQYDRDNTVSRQFYIILAIRFRVVGVELLLPAEASGEGNDGSQSEHEAI